MASAPRNSSELTLGIRINDEAICDFRGRWANGGFSYDRLTPFVSVLLSVLVAWSLSVADTAQADGDYPPLNQLSENGVFRVTIVQQPEPIELNTLHAWVVSVKTAGGEPVDDAKFDISGGMPAHDHGLPTAPRVTENQAEGNYLLQGLRFQMPGHWQVTLAITSAGVTDSVTFDLML